MDARTLIQNLAEALAHRARLGFAGEKPIAVWAMALVAGEGGLRCTGRQLLREHRAAVRGRFLELAERHGEMGNPASSWSVITGSQAELQRALPDAPNADDAFRSLGPQDAAALDEWFRARVGDERPASPSAGTAPLNAPAGSSVRTALRKETWHIQTSGGGAAVEAWATFRLPFEPHAGRRQYRERLKQALSELRGVSTGVVHALYVSRTSPANCDVENVLFYNVGAGAFRQLAPGGLSFECRAEHPPVAPDGRAFDHYVRYAISDGGRTISTASSDHVIAQISDAPIRRLRSDSKPWEIWQDIEREFDRRECAKDQREVSGSFGIDLVLSMSLRDNLNLAGALKPLFDGVVSTLHQPASVDPRVVQLVTAQIGERSDTVVRWFTRDVPVRVSTACPTELYRGSVRWHPDDSRLRAGGVFIEHGGSSTRTISLKVFEVS